MSRIKGPFKEIYLIAPDELRFDLEYEGHILIEDIDYTIKPRSLYHFFIVQLVAELQKDYRKDFKNGVPPQIVLQYLKHQNKKFGLLKKKQIHKIDALKAAWRNHLRKGEKERIHFYKKDKRIKLSDNDRVVFLQNLFLLSTMDKSKEGLFKINIDKASGLNIVSPVLKSLPLHKAHFLKDQQNKIGVSKDSILQSQEALIDSYLLLSPVEKVLQVQDPFIIPGFDTPKFFRKTGPVAADIKGGKIYIRDEVLDIIKALEKHKIVLLSGYAASGKTVIARLVAYSWFKDGRKVRFVQLKTDSVELFKLKNETAWLGEEKPDPLLVIEDAHLAWDLINEFLSWRTQDWPKILVTTREPASNLPSVVIDYFDSIYKIHIQSSHFAIVNMFFKKKGWKLSDKLMREIINVSKGNLWLQSYALRSLNKTGRKEIQYESIVEEVGRDLEDLVKIKSDLSAVTKSLMPRLLIALSVLYRYEIPMDIRFIYRKFPYPKAQIMAALGELVKRGEVLLIRDRESYLYGLPHSVLAELYYQFTIDPFWEETSVYGDADVLLCEYLLSKMTAAQMNSVNISIFSSLKFPWKNISKKLNKEKLGRRISEFEYLLYAFHYINNIYACDRKAAKELAKHIDRKKIARRISETTDFWPSAEFIRGIYRADCTAGIALWSQVDQYKLASRISESNKIESSCCGIQIIYKTNRDFGKKLWSCIDKDKFASRIYKSTYPLIIYNCIDMLFKADREIGKKLLGYIDKSKLASWISETPDVWTASLFINIFFKANHKDGEKLLGYINKAQFASMISETSKVSDAGLCINTLFETDREVGKELFGYIDKKKLANRISETPDIWAASLFINMLFKANREVGKELFDQIDMAKLASRVSETTDFFLAGRCIDLLFESNPKVGKELLDQIDIAELASRISETTDFFRAGRFIDILFKIDYVIGKELSKYIDKDRLERINFEKYL
jgi:hypothetical protein